MRDFSSITAQMNQAELKKYYEEECVGEVARIPAPPPTHQWIIQRLIIALSTCKSDDFVMLQAPTDLFLSKKQIRQPDLMVIHTNRKNIITHAGVIHAPNIVIEVLSETSHRLDKEVKLQDYYKLGVDEYWIVDPFNKQLDQYEWTKNRYTKIRTYEVQETVASKQFKQIAINLADVFN